MSDLTTTAHFVPCFPIEIYYDGLKSKHSIFVYPFNTFFYLKAVLSHETYANIPIENQKFIYRGLVPKDTDTMGMRKVGTGGFRIALVRVKSPAEIAMQEEMGRKEKTHGEYIQEAREAMSRALRENTIAAREVTEEAFQAVEENIHGM